MPGVPYKGTLANSVDPDQTPQNAASDQGQHCLHNIQECMQHITIVKLARHHFYWKWTHLKS